MKFRIIDTDVGSIALFARSGRLCRLDLFKTPAEARKWAGKRFPEAEEQPRGFEEAAGLLRRYFRGERVEFSLPLDLSDLPPFFRRVLEETRKIPRGEVASYGTIAQRSGRPRGARAVGQALHRNPIPFIIPCHRVVRKDGSLGGFGMGLDMKVRLLSLEGVALDGDRRSVRPS